MSLDTLSATNGNGTLASHDSSNGINHAESTALLPHDVAKGEEHKSLGNKLFSEHHFFGALDEYSKAIEFNPTNAIYYSNRAACHLKLETYGAAVADADAAVRIDPAFVKAYYRRGSAHFALLKYRDAVKDFKEVLKIKTNDPDAKGKLAECQKKIREEEFRKAIENENSLPPSATTNWNSIVIEDSYDGPKIDEEKGIDEAFVNSLITHFKDQKRLHRRYVYYIVLNIIKSLSALPTLLDINIPEGEKFTVCGDVHGQYYDLLNLFDLNGRPSTSNPYLFNGDFVDRGSFSFEVITVFFALKLLYPAHFHLLRGNHESTSMNGLYGFQGEVLAKADPKAFELFTEAFCHLPLAATIGGKILVVHGGLFSQDGVKLDDIRKINRNTQPPESGLMSELLWSDPQPHNGRAPSKRGVGLSFGPDVTRRFLDDNGLDLLIRSHEVKDEGYEIEAGGRLITVFSAPNYCDQMGNKAAYIKLDHTLKPKCVSFNSVPHPKIGPMQYANPMFRSMAM